MNGYLKGLHCSVCRYFSAIEETVYNRNHNGNPGSTDYEETHMYCCKNCGENHGECILLPKQKYSCKDFGAKP